MEAIEHDLDNTVTSFIPNTAETCFYGLVKGLEDHLSQAKISRIIGLGANPDPNEVKSILDERARVEKIAIKDAKLRTFITEDANRDDLVAHVYDIAYGTVAPGGQPCGHRRQHRPRHHLEEEHPAHPRSGLAPSASWWPQAHLKFATPTATASTWPDGRFHCVPSGGVFAQGTRHGRRVGPYKACKHQLTLPLKENVNQVKAIYAPFTDEEISNRISDLLTPTKA